MNICDNSGVDDAPLVSVALLTHNRNRYVREALQSILAQTYEPLEIVVSDDFSTDGTFEIITNEIAAYKASGGVHRHIVVHRNTKNIGPVRNFEKAVSLCHGDLVVEAGDDDISFPNRVARIVEAWVSGEKRAKIIHNSYFEIDVDGRVRRNRCCYLDVFSPRGAAATYAREIFHEFPCVERLDAYEDRPYACRAAIVGSLRGSRSSSGLFIDEPLLKYRVGSGMSTLRNNYRQSTIESLRHSIAGCGQNIIDLDSKRVELGEEQYLDFRNKSERAKRELEDELLLLSAETIMERFRHRKRIGWRWILDFIKGHFGSSRLPFYQILCIVPKCIGTPLLNLYMRIWYRLGY